MVVRNQCKLGRKYPPFTGERQISALHVVQLDVPASANLANVLPEASAEGPFALRGALGCLAYVNKLALAVKRVDSARQWSGPFPELQERTCFEFLDRLIADTTIQVKFEVVWIGGRMPGVDHGIGRHAFFWIGVRHYINCSRMDTLTPAERSDRMSRVRCKNTGPEILVRRLVHSLGYRYRLHVRTLPGSPDLAFRSRKAVIFVHGCFWHRHACAMGDRTPKSRVRFWRQKLDANRIRDKRKRAELRAAGWRVLVIWECQTRETDEISSKIKRFLDG